MLQTSFRYTKCLNYHIECSTQVIVRLSQNYIFLVSSTLLLLDVRSSNQGLVSCVPLLQSVYLFAMPTSGALRSFTNALRTAYVCAAGVTSLLFVAASKHSGRKTAVLSGQMCSFGRRGRGEMAQQMLKICNFSVVAQNKIGKGLDTFFLLEKLNR